MKSALRKRMGNSLSSEGRDVRLKREEEAWLKIVKYESKITVRGLPLAGKCGVDGCFGTLYCKFHKKSMCKAKFRDGLVSCFYDKRKLVDECYCEIERTKFESSRQFRVSKFLYDNGIRFRYDEFVGNNRPDLLIKTEMGYIDVEIDEYQHSLRDPFEELKRMVDIQIVLDAPVIFIRFNTDVSESGYDERLNYLLTIVKWAINEKQIIDTDHKIRNIAVFYMFYDIYDPRGGVLKFL